MSTDYYESCGQCPRLCKSDRNKSFGFCKESSALRIASACLHFGEEPPLTVFNGSGTIFFTGCTLRCAFCQNYQISQQGMGAEVSREDFVKICLELQRLGAENINLVTGSHHIPLIADFIRAAKDSGLTLPIAWNSSAYESLEMLELLSGLIDIWLPDLKTLNPMMSSELFKAEDYPSVAKKAIRYMISTSPLKFCQVKGKDGSKKEKMLSGIIIRHLFLPGRMEDTHFTLDWLKKHADGKACISLMSQYTPVPFKEGQASLEKRNKSLSSFQNRLVNEAEDKELRKIIDSYQFEYLFYQDLSDDSSWLPDFARKQPFSNELAKPIWHWKDKFSI